MKPTRTRRREEGDKKDEDDEMVDAITNDSTNYIQFTHSPTIILLEE